MTFGISKCATMIVKYLNYKSSPIPFDPTFYLSFNPPFKTNKYTNFGIHFDESLELKPIVFMLNSKINHKFN